MESASTWSAAYVAAVEQFARVPGSHSLVGRWLGIIAALALWLPTPLLAQQYQADEVDNRANFFAEVHVRNPAGYAADKQRFADFFERYYFPMMTQFTPKALEDLGGKRYDLFNRYLWRTESEELQRDLTELAFNYMQRVIYAGKYHPAVRYNATLILGLLDEQYGIERGANARPPKPLKKANVELTKVIDLAAQGRRVPLSLVVGALVGLERHAKYHDSLDRDAVDAMSVAVTKLAAREEPLAEADRDVSEWIKLRAASVLAELGSVGPNNQVHTTLVKMIAGDSRPRMFLTARCEVAALLGKINYDGAQVDGRATGDAILELAAAVAKDEAELAKQFDEMHILGGGYASNRRSKGRIRTDEFGQQLTYDTRDLLARLRDLRTALSATRPIVPEDMQATCDVVVAAVNPVIDAAQNEDAVSLDVTNKVRVMAEAIERVVKPEGAPAAEVASDPG